MTFLLGRWLQAIKRKTALGAGNRCRAKRLPPMRFVPRLEALEDRTVPSILTVTNNLDTGVAGDGSLRGEIAAAQSGDTINFDPSLAGQTITLTSGELDINKNLDIEGPGANQLTVAEGGFRLGSTADVRISGLTMTNGPGIINNGTASVSDCTFSGAAISNYNGTASVSDCTISGDHGFSAALNNQGVMTVNNSTVSNNQATDSEGGGGVFNQGTLTINNSTIAGNKVIAPPGGFTSSGGYVPPGYGVGGGIYMIGGTLSINSSTLANNQAIGGTATTVYNNPAGTGQGGGLYIAGGTVSIDHSTLAGNEASGGAGIIPGVGYGGGIYNAAGASALQIHDTILADNTADFDPDLDGSFTSQGYNLIGNSAGGSGFAASDLLNLDPQLGPLQNNGGPTQTMALLPGSPAIDAGDNNGAPDYDQRGPGFARIVNGTIDIGAFEVQSSNVTQPSNRTVVGFPAATTASSAGSFPLMPPNADGATAAGSDASLAAVGTAYAKPLMLPSTPPSLAPDDVPRGDQLFVASLNEGMSFLVLKAKSHLWSSGVDSGAEAVW